MSENFKENEEIEEASGVAQDSEEVIEEACDAAIGAVEAGEAMESVIEEGMHEDIDISGIQSAVEPEVAYAVGESVMEEIPTKSKKGVVVGVVIALVAALLIGAAVMCFVIRKAPYNYLGYINVSGKSIGEIAELQGFDYDEFIAAYNLPSDMPKSTDEAAAYYTIPTGIMAQMYGMDFDTFKMLLEIPDTISDVSLRYKLIDMLSDKFNVGEVIDENTPWGITEGEMTLGAYVGDEDAVEELKAEYELDDKITVDSRWKEVRNAIDKVNLQARKEAEKMAEDDIDSDVIDTDEIDTDDVDSASADATASADVDASSTGESTENAQTAE